MHYPGTLRPYPGIGHAVLMTIAAVVLQSMLGGIWAVGGLVISGELFDPDLLASGDFSLEITPLMLTVVNVLSLGAIVAWGRAANQVPWSTLAPLRSVPAAALVAVVISSFGLSILLSECDNLLRVVLPMPDWFIEMMGGLGGGGEIWGTAFVLILVAPLTEEPVFRGVILRGLAGRHSPAVAIGVSAVLFGAMHANPWQFVTATALGIVYGWWFLRTRSLVPCLIGHALNNGLVLALSHVTLGIPGYSMAEIPEGPVFQPLWFDAIGVFLLATGIFLFRWSTPDAPPAEETRPPPIPFFPAPLPAVVAVPNPAFVAAPADAVPPVSPGEGSNGAAPPM